MNQKAQVRLIAPTFLVKDVQASAMYYVDRLGFRLLGYFGDPPTFGIVERDGAEIMMNQLGPSDEFRPNGDYDGRIDAYVWVSDADALYDELMAKGADIVCEPETQPWNTREFLVRDLDRHLLAFGQDTSGINSKR